MSPEARIERALEVVMEYGTTDGERHKMWVIDQMVRELTGCPTVQKEVTTIDGDSYVCDHLGRSAEYDEFVRKRQHGEDGPNTYTWNTGNAP